MASMTEITCACGCGRKKQVRTADVKRGWGKYYDKSCKARHQEQRTHQYKAHRYAREYGGNPCFDHKGEYVGFTGQYIDEDV